MSQATATAQVGASRLRIGVDATCLASRRGYGRFVRELLPALLTLDPENEYVLFADPFTAPEVEHLAARCVQPRTRESQAAAASARGRRRIPDMWRMGRAVANEGVDVMYFPSVYSFYPVPGRTPVVVAFHDTIPEHFGEVVFPTRMNRWLWDAKVALARRRARAIITVSEWSRKCLAEEFGTPLESIHVTVEAPSAVFRPALEGGPREAWLRAHGLTEQARYFMYVGGFNPHKNLIALVEAFAKVCAERPDEDLQLLLVGDTTSDNFHIDVEGLRAAVARCGLDDRVHLPGFVPDEELRHLYSGTLALVLPSLEEGFGLPAVEAAACGAPCVATLRSPLPQLLADGGIFIDPADGAQLERALGRMADDAGARKQLAAAALERASALSWQATARATRDALVGVARAAR